MKELACGGFINSWPLYAQSSILRNHDPNPTARKTSVLYSTLKKPYYQWFPKNILRYRLIKTYFPALEETLEGIFWDRAGDSSLCVSTWLGPEVPRYLIKHHSDVSLKVFLDEMNIWVGKVSKVDCSPNIGGPQLKTWIEQKSRVRKTPVSTCLLLSSNISLLLPLDSD